MNWNKILNMFIGIFLILNLSILGVDNYIEKSKFTLSTERKAVLDKVLDEKNISIKDFLPTYYPKPILIMSSQSNKSGEIVENIMGNQTFEVEESALATTYASSDQILVFNQSIENEGITANEGVVSYEATTNKYMPKNFTEKEIIKVAKEFAKDITLSNNEFVVTARDLTKLSEGKYILELNEVYKDEVLFCSYVNVSVTKEGIIEAMSRRFNPIE